MLCVSLKTAPLPTDKISPGNLLAEKSKTSQAWSAYGAKLIFVSVAFSRTPADAARHGICGSWGLTVYSPTNQPQRDGTMSWCWYTAATAIYEPATTLGTCEASWFDSISNRTSDSRFDLYWWSDSKLSNRPPCQSSFAKKWLVVVKFVFKVNFGSKISVHCLTRFMTELKWTSTQFGVP